MATVELGGKTIGKRRRLQRDALWPDAGDVVWQPATGGWARMPRTIPMIASLIDGLGGKRETAGRLFLTLWAHEFGDGLVEVNDPALLAFEAGYTTNRGERTFEERITLLEKLGFLRSKSLGPRTHGVLLLLDPHVVVQNLREKSPASVPDNWWSAFQARCRAVGIVPGLKLPTEDVAPEGVLARPLAAQSLRIARASAPRPRAQPQPPPAPGWPMPVVMTDVAPQPQVAPPQPQPQVAPPQPQPQVAPPLSLSPVARPTASQPRIQMLKATK